MEKELNFDDYIEIKESGKVVGFKLEGDPFLYRYNSHGGWYDAKGNYYNSEAVKCQPPDSSSDQEVHQQQKEGVQQAVLGAKLQKRTQRQETLRQLIQLIDSHPEGSIVELQIQDDHNIIKDADLDKLFEGKGIKEKFNNFKIHVDKKIASELVELQGTKLKDTTLYIYVKLYDSDLVQMAFNEDLSEKDLINELENLSLEKNKDFANIQQHTESAIFELSKKKWDVVAKGLKYLKMEKI